MKVEGKACCDGSTGRTIRKTDSQIGRLRRSLGADPEREAASDKQTE
jgi:hypothetical protein